MTGIGIIEKLPAAVAAVKTSSAEIELESEKPFSAKRSESKTLSKEELAAKHKKIFQKVCRRIKLDYDLAQVIGTHGIHLKRAASGYLVANCPFPNHADKSPSFKIKLSKPDKYICYGCQASGDVLDFIRDFHYLKNIGEAVEHLTGKTVKENWNQMKNGKAKPPQEKNDVSIADSAEAAPDEEKTIDHEQIRRELDNATDVYIALIGLLGIEPEHVKQFEARGISLQEATQLGYRSLPCDRNERIKICKNLRRAGYDLNNVPGFYRLPKRKYSKGQYCFGGNGWGFRDIKTENGEVFEVPGVLIPTRDLEGRIRRLKIRNDAPAPDLPDEVKYLFPARYMAFSSTDRDAGASAGSFVHVARPLYQNGNIGTPKTESVLWITEGEIKADVSALYLQETVLGMPGVGQCPDKAITQAQAGNFSEICVAMDAEDKPHVKLAIAKLIRLAKQNGLGASVAVWEAAQGKGLDDLVAAGGAPMVMSPESWWQHLTDKHKDYIHQRIFENRGTTKKSEVAGENSNN